MLARVKWFADDGFDGDTKKLRELLSDNIAPCTLSYAKVVAISEFANACVWFDDDRQELALYSRVKIRTDEAPEPSTFKGNAPRIARDSQALCPAELDDQLYLHERSARRRVQTGREPCTAGHAARQSSSRERCSMIHPLMPPTLTTADSRGDDVDVCSTPFAPQPCARSDDGASTQQRAAVSRGARALRPWFVRRRQDGRSDRIERLSLIRFLKGIVRSPEHSKIATRIVRWSTVTENTWGDESPVAINRITVRRGEPDIPSDGDHFPARNERLRRRVLPISIPLLYPVPASLLRAAFPVAWCCRVAFEVPLRL